MRSFWILFGLLFVPSVRRRYRRLRAADPRRQFWRRPDDDELRRQIAAGERNPDWMLQRTLERLYSPRECPCSRCVAVRRSGVHPLQLI